MRIDIPVYIHKSGKLQYGDGDAVLLDQTGNITWRYCGKKHNGVAIASCIRSGSQYTTKVLHKIGLNVGHEYQAPDGSVGYHLVVIRPKNCLHQVRHPLGQIASNMSHHSWGFCDQVIDLSNYSLLGCMQYWLKWNQLCEEFCVWRYQIEQFPIVWNEFLDRIGHEHCILPDVPTDTNKSKEPIHKLTWDNLFAEDRELAQEILDKANEYGYDVPEMDKTEYQNLGELETAQVASV